jgi:hypothetical protein
MLIVKRKYQIEFFTADWTARKYYPVKMAKDCLPEFWKRMSGTNYNHDTVKKCPGINDWMLTGFIISAWSDIVITQSEEFGTSAVLRNGADGASAHAPSQCIDLLTDKSHYHGTVKLPGTWHIKTSPGWSIMIVPLWYWKDQPWEALPGIIHTDNHHTEINFNFTMKSTKESITIPAGSPIVQIIPFKRDAVSAVSRAKTNEDIKRHGIILSMYHWTKNGVTKFYKQRMPYSLIEKDTDFEESLKYPLEQDR